MADHHGKSAKFDVGGAITGARNWGVDEVAETDDATDFQSSGHREHIIGLDGWSGTAEILFQGGAPPVTLGASGTFKGYVDATKYITGTVTITGVTWAVNVEGIEVLGVTFLGNGALDKSNLT